MTRPSHTEVSGRGRESGTQSTFRVRPHWPFAIAGTVVVMLLVLVLSMTGGTGAGAQPGPPPADAGSVDRPVGESSEAASDSEGDRTGSDQAEQPEPPERSSPRTPTPPRIATDGPGTFVRADVDGPRVGEKRAQLLRYDVRVEKGLPFDPEATAREIQATLSDPRSWIGSGDWRLELVSRARRADFTVYLTAPDTTDRLCYPLRTYGKVSCQAGNRVVLNARRWAFGADAYGADVDAYRRYLVNHEVGHRLGRRHVGCPGKGKRAPVMMQQTKGLGGCTTNPWPAPKRR